MSWMVRFSSHAEKYYGKLDKKLKKRIKREIIDLSKLENPLQHHHVRPLTGELKGFYRLRVGGYRIVFSLLEEDKIIAVVNVVPRGNAY